jgi:hypothetical protein
MFQKKAKLNEVDRAVGLVREHDRTAAELERKIADLTAEQTAGETAFVDGAQGDLDRLSRIQVEVGLLRRRSAKLAADRTALVEAVGMARSNDLLAEAAVARAEYEKIRSATTDLLKQLSALEGVWFNRQILASQPVGEWADLVGTGLPAGECGIGAGLVSQGGSVAVPKSHIALRRAIELERQAEMIQGNAFNIGTQILETPAEEPAAA